MRLWFALYVLDALDPRSGLSSRAESSVREGALIKIECEDGIGYADLHPWPELGDLPIQEQLSILESGETTPLSQRTLELARLDARARKAKANAFAGLVVPRSHFLVTDLTKLKPARLAAIKSEGYTALKAKMGRNLKAEREKWLELLSAPEAQGLTWRFDFNASPSVDEVVEFAKGLPAHAKAAIEFIEDPVAWDAAVWKSLREQTGLKFALDRAIEASSELVQAGDQAFDVLILKPAIQDPAVIAGLAKKAGLGLVVTSYLDHPVGQIGAALEAARLAQDSSLKLLECGLVSHLAYHETDFSADLKIKDARLIPPQGMGIGFDHLLHELDWWELRG